MKAKCIRQKTTTSYKFFLLMVVPLLIGTMISLISFSNAEWETQDVHIAKSPLQQGWVEVKGDELKSNL
ncbi:MAG: hypothetical protein HYX35_04120 [Proteobacteria bacterium]|nr:hypothetical protein [Pseudomonadota bacterium]